MNQNDGELYRQIQKRFKLHPEYVEEYGKVKKMITKEGIFALKKVKFSAEQRSRFLYTVRNLHQKGYRPIIPLLLTSDGEFLVHHDQSDYYIMPWLESYPRNMADQYDGLMEQAAKIHHFTTQHRKADPLYFQSFYEATMITIDRRKLDYERFIENCEKKIYMSPFELLFCTYFVQLIRSENQASIQLEEWYDTVKEKQQDRFVICHGNLAPKHLLHDDKGNHYLINFDRSFTASPIYDLRYFFKKLFYWYPHQAKNASQIFSQYNRYYPLKVDELLLLSSYILQTDKIHRLIHQYQETRNFSEQRMNVKLQRSIWQMQAGHTFVQHLHEQIAKENA